MNKLSLGFIKNKKLTKTVQKVELYLKIEE